MPIGHAGALIHLGGERFISEANGTIDVIQSVASRARHAYELAAGENPFPNEPQATRMNPRGRIGVDLSGPPWGSAVLHPIAWCGGLKSTGNVQNEKQATSVLALGPKMTTGPWAIYNRQHEKLPAPMIAPYGRGYLRFVARTDPGISSADLVVSLYQGREWDGLRARSETITISTGSTPVLVEIDDAWFDLEPGQNHLWIVWENLDGSEDIIIDSMSVHQVVKRSH